MRKRGIDMTKKTTIIPSRKDLFPMTAAAIYRAAVSDPDARPLTALDIKRMKRTPQAKIIRRALSLIPARL